MRDAMSLLDQVIAFSGNEARRRRRDARARRGRSRGPPRARAALVEGNAADVSASSRVWRSRASTRPRGAKDILRPPAQPGRRQGRAGSGGRRRVGSRVLDLADEELATSSTLARSRGGRRPVALCFRASRAGFDEIVRSGQPRRGSLALAPGAWPSRWRSCAARAAVLPLLVRSTSCLSRTVG
jgi:hypothetical protein